jgi:LPS export ABC transporter protein LptC
MPTVMVQGDHRRDDIGLKRLALLIAFSGVVLGGVVLWFFFSGTPVSGLSWQVGLPLAITREEHGIRMEKFALRDTQRQQTRWEILADVAQVDQQADTTTIEGVHLTLFSAKYGMVLVTARRGIIQNQSKNMQVCGDVRLVMGDEFALATECLQWNSGEQALAADTPVIIAMGNFHVAGQGFRGWIAEERFEVHEQVLARWSEP